MNAPDLHVVPVQSDDEREADTLQKLLEFACAQAATLREMQRLLDPAMFDPSLTQRSVDAVDHLRTRIGDAAEIFEAFQIFENAKTTLSELN